MLHNASEKLSVGAKVLLYVGIALSVIGGFFIIWFGANAHIPAALHYDYYTNTIYRVTTAGSASGLAIIGGFLVMVFGSLLTWLIALKLRTFGDMASDIKAIRSQLDDVLYEAEAPVYAQAAGRPEAPKAEAAPTEASPEAQAGGDEK